MKTKYYRLGAGMRAKVEKTSKGYKVTVNDVWETMHKTLESAMTEILSYCEVDEADF